MQGICDKNIFYIADSRKNAEQYEKIHSANRKTKYQMFFQKQIKSSEYVNKIYLLLQSSK